MSRIADILKGHPGAIAGVLGAALFASIAIPLSTLPLAPGDPGAGSSGSAPAAAGSARVSAPADEAGKPDDGHEAPEENEGDQAEGDKSPDEEPADKANADGGSGSGGAGATPEKPSKPGGTPSSGKPQGGSSTQKPSSGGGQAQKPATGGSQTQGPSRPKPSHTHSWQAVYRDEPVYSQQWVSKWEDVYTRHERYQCTTCGATYYSLGEMNAHLDSTIDWDEMTGHAGYLDDSYTTVEKVDKGSYQTVQTGTKRVLDHHECACGARK